MKLNGKDFLNSKFAVFPVGVVSKSSESCQSQYVSAGLCWDIYSEPSWGMAVSSLAMLFLLPFIK